MRLSPLLVNFKINLDCGKTMQHKAITDETPVLVTNQLKEVRVKDDDWTGKSDSAERRKRQNRLHQRAWRRRRALQARDVTPGKEKPRSISRGKSTAKKNLYLQQVVGGLVSGQFRMPVFGVFEQPETRLAFWEALEESLDEPQSMFAYWGELREQRKREIMSTLSQEGTSQFFDLTTNDSHYHDCGDSPNSQESYASSTSDNSLSPRSITSISDKHNSPSIYFPLSMDHQLFVLIQYNTLRGAMTNMSILYNLGNPAPISWLDSYTTDLPSPPPSTTTPSSLQPTALQKAIPHESWIDAIPYPALRNNIINHQDSIDIDALCDDFMGGMYEGLSEVENRGIVLWGQPWEVGGWEISEGFVRKWEFLMKDCEELIVASNRWREGRGEQRLVVEL